MFSADGSGIVDEASGMDSGDQGRGKISQDEGNSNMSLTNSKYNLEKIARMAKSTCVHLKYDGYRKQFFRRE